MKKIRTHLIEFIVKLLNDNLNDKSYILHKIDKINRRYKRFSMNI